MGWGVGQVHFIQGDNLGRELSGLGTGCSWYSSCNTGLLFVDCGLLKSQSWQIAESPISGHLRLRVERSGWGLCRLVLGSGLWGKHSFASWAWPSHDSACPGVGGSKGSHGEHSLPCMSGRPTAQDGHRSSWVLCVLKPISDVTKMLK